MDPFEAQYGDTVRLPLPRPAPRPLPPAPPLPLPPPSGQSYYDRIVTPGARQSANVDDLRQPLSDPDDLRAAHIYNFLANKKPYDPSNGAAFDAATGIASWATGRDWDDQAALARTLVTRLNAPVDPQPMRYRIGTPNTRVVTAAPVMVRPHEMDVRTVPSMQQAEQDPVGWDVRDPADSGSTNPGYVVSAAPLPQPRTQLRPSTGWTPETMDDNNRRIREQQTGYMAQRRQAEADDAAARDAAMRRRLDPNSVVRQPTPQVGAIVRGWRYLGGNPNDPRSWSR